jgi:hypothetical protein
MDSSAPGYIAQEGREGEGEGDASRGAGVVREVVSPMLRARHISATLLCRTARAPCPSLRRTVDE